jgi:hypothetical protein
MSTSVSLNNIQSLELLFPTSRPPIPREITKLILSFLVTQKIARMKEVNRSWNRLISTDRKFTHRILFEKCLYKANVVVNTINNINLAKDKTLTKILTLEIQCNFASKANIDTIESIKHRVEPHLAMAKKDPNYDFEPLLAPILTLLKSDDEDDRAYGKDCVEKILQGVAEYDVHKAKTLAERISNGKDWPLNTFVKIAAQHDLGVAKETALALIHDSSRDWALRDIVKIEAKKDPELAKTSAYMIVSSGCKALALETIVMKELKLNLKKAKVTAISIDNDRGEEKGKALLAVLREEVKQDFSLAKETAQLFLSLDAFGRRDEVERLQSLAVLEIVKEEAKVSLAAAKAMANTIKNVEIKIQGFLEIAKIDPQHDFSQAKELAKSSGRSTNFLLSEIVKVECDYDLQAAHATAQTINDSDMKVDVLLILAKKDSLHDFSLAKAAALEPKESCDRDAHLVSIVKVEKNYNAQAAKITAQMIEAGYESDPAFMEIVEVEAQTNIEAAKTTAQMIKCSINRDEALLVITQIEAQQNLDSAYASALTIIDPRLQIEALLAISKIAWVKSRDAE